VSLQRAGIFKHKTLGSDFEIAVAKARDWNALSDPINRALTPRRFLTLSIPNGGVIAALPWLEPFLPKGFAAHPDASCFPWRAILAQVIELSPVHVAKLPDCYRAAPRRSGCR